MFHLQQDIGGFEVPMNDSMLVCAAHTPANGHTDRRYFRGLGFHSTSNSAREHPSTNGMTKAGFS